MSNIINILSSEIQNSENAAETNLCSTSEKICVPFPAIYNDKSHLKLGKRFYEKNTPANGIYFSAISTRVVEFHSRRMKIKYSASS